MKPKEPSLVVELIVEQLRGRVPGGIGTYCRGLLGGVRQLSHPPAVRLYASRLPRGELEDPLLSLGFPLKTSALPAAVLAVRWDRLSFFGRRDDPRAGVVHATSLALPPKGGSPLVATVHDLGWRRLPDAYPRHGREWHERALVRAARVADAFVVPSGQVAGDLLGSGLGIAADRVAVIAEGADHLPAPDFAAARRTLEDLGIELSVGFVLAVGTLEPRKNLRRVIEAYRDARPLMPEPWPLLVVGPSGWGNDERVVNTTVSDLGAALCFAGHVEGPVLSALYAMARCAVYVPLYEGFGLPAVEAMSCGVPVVVSRDVPSAGAGGLAVDPLDTAAISQAIFEATSLESTRQLLIGAGRERAGELTWRACAAAHVDLWAALR